jgi:hypothetical protein
VIPWFRGGSSSGSAMYRLERYANCSRGMSLWKREINSTISQAGIDHIGLVPPFRDWELAQTSCPPVLPSAQFADCSGIAAQIIITRIGRNCESSGCSMVGATGIDLRPPTTLRHVGGHRGIGPIGIIVIMLPCSLCSLCFGHRRYSLPKCGPMNTSRPPIFWRALRASGQSRRHVCP